MVCDWLYIHAHVHVCLCLQPMEVRVADDTTLKLRSLKQYYVKLLEGQKNRKLLEILDALEFNQVR